MFFWLGRPSLKRLVIRANLQFYESKVLVTVLYDLYIFSMAQQPLVGQDLLIIEALR
jgi:hypothetical protein